MKTLQPTAATIRQLCAAGLATFLLAEPALAYVGPGLGLATIGAILGGIAAIFLAIIGVFWYPIRSMMRKRRAAAEQQAERKEPVE
jgi:hypothetical protein